MGTRHLPGDRIRAGTGREQPGALSGSSGFGR